MAVHGHGQHALGLLLADDVLIEVIDDCPGRGNLGEGLLAGAPLATLLVQDVLTQVDAFAADVDVAGSFDQRSDVAIALAAETTEGVIALGAAGIPAVQVPTSGHEHS